MTPTLVPALASGGLVGFSRCLVGGGLIPDQSRDELAGSRNERVAFIRL